MRKSAPTRATQSIVHVPGVGDVFAAIDFSNASIESDGTPAMTR